MTEEAQPQKQPKKREGRSPAYPFIPVQKALEKATALYAQENSHAAPLTSALGAWGYSPKSSGGRQTLATMKYFGLIEVTGDGDTRMIKVSDIARRIILDQREDETEKRQLIRTVALMPSAHKFLYQKYPSGLASDGTVCHFLIFEKGFNSDAAKELLAEFKDTASYIGLYQPENTIDKDRENGHFSDAEDELPEVKTGDRIQCTIQGVDQFVDGAQVIGLSDDGQWVFTDKSMTGVAVKDVKVIEAPKPKELAAPPAMPAHLLDAIKAREAEVKPSGSRKAVFPLDDGDVTLIFPEAISPEGLTELGQYLDIFLKKEIKKSVGSKFN